MKTTLLFLLLSLSYITTGQTFTEVPQTPPFDGVQSGSVAFSDVDGDNDLDVLITGQNNSLELIARLYINDGVGNFTEMAGTTLEGVGKKCSIAFADVDGDNDQDVLITGENNSDEAIAKLYTNDGLGNFTEMTGTPFKGVIRSSIAFSDVNGDGHNDVLITGKNGTLPLSELTSNLYINDGQGNFTEMTDTPFKGAFFSSIAFSDVNGDGHNDVLITGNSTGRIAKLYTNDGLGNFTEMTGTPFEGVDLGSIAFSDVDGDNDQDVLITGENRSREATAKLYTNDGLGKFTEMTGTPFEGVIHSSIAFSDVDGDNDLDVLITGRNGSGDDIATLYINDGLGSFTEKNGLPFVGVAGSSIAFSDVNSDGYDDVLITGRNSSNFRIAKLYINDGMISSTDHLSPGVQLELTPYPNPTSSNRVNLRFESTEIGYAQLGVYDVNGHLLRTKKELTGIGKQTLSMDIASLPPGSYFIQLDTGKRNGTVTLVVQ